jgi:hypothetical protein
MPSEKAKYFIRKLLRINYFAKVVVYPLLAKLAAIARVRETRKMTTQ